MNTQTTTGEAIVSRPKITLMMILCGIVTAASAGAVSAATTQDDVPRIIVRYDAKSLATDSGARALYRRLVNAADEVCPNMAVGTRLISDATRHCREQAIVRAVSQIDNPRLAAIHNNGSKSG